MKRFLKVGIWDYVLCLLCQTGLIFHVFAYFVLEDGISGNPVLVILILAVLDILYFIYISNKILKKVGLVLGIAVILGLLFWVLASGVARNEGTNSLGLTLFLIVMSSLIVFLLTRKRGGIIALFLIGSFLSVWAHFVQYETVVWAFLIFEISVFLMFLYRNYLITVADVKTGKLRLPMFIIQSVAVCLAALLIGTGVYYGIIGPANPPTRELNLISFLDDRDMLWLFGLESNKEEPEPEAEEEESADPEPEEKTEQEEPEDDQQEEQPPEENSDTENQDTQTPAPPNLTDNQDSSPDHLQNEKRPALPKGILLLILIAAAITAAFLIRYLRKKQWSDKVSRLSPENQVINYYQYFLSRFSRIGYKKQPQETLYEYAEGLSQKLRPFSSSGVTFDRLTEIYINTYYGSHPVTEEQAASFRSYYHDFSQNARKELGFFRYCLKYFAL